MPALIPEKLRRFFQGENSMRLVVLAGLAGLVCILLSSFFPDNEEKTAQKDNASMPQEEGMQEQSAETYAEELEKRLEAILMQIEGVGSCRVMITVSGSASYTYAQDVQQNTREEQLEIQREHVVLDEDSGDAPLVERIANPEVVGVIVACEGGENHVVRELIFEAVHAALDVPHNRICVTKRIHEN